MTTPGSYKTALCIPSFTFGGAEMQAFLLARIMHSKGINVEIIALGRKGELIKEIEKEGISWSHFPMNSLTSGSRISRLLSFLKFIRFLKHRKIHTLIGYTYHPNIWCGAAWRRAGIRHFYWNQRSAADEMPVSRIEKMAISSAPGYIANATAGADFISKRHGVPLEKIRIIHNG